MCGKKQLRALVALALDAIPPFPWWMGQPLWEAFASADVFCMPSDSETLGFVVLESMASACP